MNRYTFRLDVLPEVNNIEERIKQFIDKLETPKYLISYEISKKTKKPHYQGIIYTDLKHATYQQRVHRELPEWKKSAKSTALVKDDAYEIYITKDGNYKFVKGYTEQEIEDLHQQSYTVEQTTTPVQICDNIEKQKLARMSWFAQLTLNTGKAGLKASSEGWEIVAVIIKTYQEHLKCEPNDFQLRNYAKSIQRHMYYLKAQEEDNPSIYENYVKKRAMQVIGSEWIKE